MCKKYIIIYYTNEPNEPKQPEIFFDNKEDMAALFDRIRELTFKKAKFAIYEIGECLGDFS